MFIGPGTYLVARGSTAAATWAPMNTDANRYYRAFTGLVIANTVVIVVLTAFSLAALSRPARRTAFALAVVALAALARRRLSGRFDVWPAALTALALTLGPLGGCSLVPRSASAQPPRYTPCYSCLF